MLQVNYENSFERGMQVNNILTGLILIGLSILNLIQAINDNDFKPFLGTLS